MRPSPSSWTRAPDAPAATRAAAGGITGCASATGGAPDGRGSEPKAGWEPRGCRLNLNLGLGNRAGRGSGTSLGRSGTPGRSLPFSGLGIGRRRNAPRPTSRSFVLSNGFTPPLPCRRIGWRYIIRSLRPKAQVSVALSQLAKCAAASNQNKSPNCSRPADPSPTQMTTTLHDSSSAAATSRS